MASKLALRHDLYTFGRAASREPLYYVNMGRLLATACSKDPQLGENWLEKALAVFVDMENAIAEQGEDNDG